MAGDSNLNSTLRETVACYSGRISSMNGVWQSDNPLTPTLPIFSCQFIVIIFLVRILRLVLKPLQIPHFIPEILSGLLISRDVLGELYGFRTLLFPRGSEMVFETIANLGLVYFSFLLGLEIDIETMRRPSLVALLVAIAGIILPFITGVGIFFVLWSADVETSPAGAIFCGTSLAVTSFPILAQILADLKLLQGELGRLAMSIAVITEVVSWALLAACTAACNAPVAFAEATACAAGLTMLCYHFAGHAVLFLAPEGENATRFRMCAVLAGAMLAALAAEACGVHSIAGAFVFGVSVPNGVTRSVLIEKLEDVVAGLLVPLYYAGSGLKTDFTRIDFNPSNIFKLVFCIFLACTSKIVGTILISHFNEMPLKEGTALGVLMNTKGLMAIIILDIAREKMLINELIFATLLASIILMTAMVWPILKCLHVIQKTTDKYVQRDMIGSGPAPELRIMACIYSIQTIPSLINFLHICNPTPESPLHVFVLHLVELTGRASAMLVLHSTRRSYGGDSRAESESDQICDALEKFEQDIDEDAASVQLMTAMSSYTSMHRDICGYAEDKCVSLLLVPYHEQRKINGRMEEENPAIRGVNHNVLGDAPCSVGVFLDRGLKTMPGFVKIAILFFGGPDDREALTYATRTLTRRGTTGLTLVRFVLCKKDEKDTSSDNKDNEFTILTHDEREKRLDDDMVESFRVRMMGEENVEYVEVASNSGDESLSMIKGMDNIFDLFVVGRGDKMVSQLTSGLGDWTECPELGPIGDLLVSSDCAASVSVLVVQRYAGQKDGNSNTKFWGVASL